MRTIPAKTKDLTAADTEKHRRFYVTAPESIQIALQQEAAQRNTKVWILGGIVLERWILSGCPEFGPAIYEPELQLPEELPLKRAANNKEEK